MAASGARLARGWAAAIAATGIAALSHMAAGGHVPGFGIFILSLALSGMVCTILASHLLSLWRLCTAVVISQGLYHGLFSLGSGAAVMGPGHSAHLVHPIADGSIPAHTETGILLTDHAIWQMRAGHAVACLVTIAVLRYSEATLVHLIAVLGMKIIRFLPFFHLPAIGPKARVSAFDWPVWPLHSLEPYLLVMRHRGPPHLAAVS